MTIPLPLATDLAAERAHELTAAASIHRLARAGRLSRRAKRAQCVAETSSDVSSRQPSTLRSAA
jgi:hypothetical protein